MLALVLPTAVALAAGLVSGGSLSRLTAAEFRWWPAVVLVFGIELILYNPPLDGQAWALYVGPWVWVAARLVLVAVLVVNARAGPKAWWVAALGVSLNTLVIVLNGGHMPQLATWGVSQLDPTRLQNVAAMAPETRLAWLSDVIAEPDWLPRRNVVSVGDILLAAGLAAWVYSATSPKQNLAQSKIGCWIGTPYRWSRRRSQAEAREVRRFFASDLWYR
jgi:hypothetical protein